MPRGTSDNRLEFDAGIIFDDESTYLCISFERLGIAPSSQIVSIETSCECMQGSVVSYLAPNQEEAYAVRLDFIAEPRSVNSSVTAALLSVQVRLDIEGDLSGREFWINLVHSESGVAVRQIYSNDAMKASQKQLRSSGRFGLTNQKNCWRLIATN